MHKPLHLLIGCLSAFICFAQKTDTLVLQYKPDQFTLSKQDRQKLDSFIIKGWDQLSINGYTDETETNEYNMELSKKRSAGVYNYLMTMGISGNKVLSKYFGETMPVGDNSSDDGRAQNRRTEIIGYQFPQVKLKPIENPMKPVTQTLDNGFIITYQPGAMSSATAANLQAGSGINFQQITNTREMRENNFFNNTTRGEILSSMLIISFDDRYPCKLDSPVLLRVPVPFQTDCNIQKLKFFVSVFENGKQIWKEENKTVFKERINGQDYACVWVNNFCGSVNFDFKIPECYDTDSTQLLITRANVKSLVTELKGVNSVYLPRKLNDSTYSILYLKHRLTGAAITFLVYKGKKRIRGYVDQSLTDLPYNDATKQYVISTGTLRFYFPQGDVYDVLLKINKEKYRVLPEKNMYEFNYLNRSRENISVDFTVGGPKKSVVQYKNQLLSSLPYDETTGCYIIDKKFLNELKQKETVAKN